ncbi:MAG: hypothetical protein KDB27_01500, partial [Planctomycetales bacterium]|nr:hypothetical protein [Planctomycetales bacterium]
MTALDEIRKRWPSYVYVCLLLLLSALLGCAARRVNCSLPTQDLLPFSENGEAEMPDRWWTEFGDPELNFCVEQA